MYRALYVAGMGYVALSWWEWGPWAAGALALTEAAAWAMAAACAAAVASSLADMCGLTMALLATFVGGRLDRAGGLPSARVARLASAAHQGQPGNIKENYKEPWMALGPSLSLRSIWCRCPANV